MKRNRMKAIGITVGVCAALWMTPNSVKALEDGKSLNLDINLLNEKEGKAAIVDIQIDDTPIVGDLKAKIPSHRSKESDVKVNALSTVELGGGDLVEELNVSVLENNTPDTEKDGTTPTPSVPAPDNGEVIKPGTGNEQGNENPGTSNSQESDDVENGQVPGANDQNDESSNNDSTIGVAGDTPDLSKSEEKSTIDQIRDFGVALGFANSKDAKNNSNFTGNMDAVLPKTGGLIDVIPLLTISLVLLASGLVLRRAVA